MEKRRKNIIINIGLLLALLIILLLAWSLRTVLLPFFLAVMLTYLLLPFVERLKKRGVSVLLSVIIIYALVFLLLFLLFYFAVPELVRDAQDFLELIPTMIDKAGDWWEQFNQKMARFPIPESVSQGIGDFTAQLEATMGEKVEGWAASFFHYIQFFISFLLAPFLSYYMLRDKDIFKKQIISWLPPKERPEILRMSSNIDHILRQFLCGYLWVSILVGTLAAIFLAILGVKYALLLGLIVGIADLIPYFGPFLGAIPAVAVALGENMRLAIFTVIALLIVQQMESSVITPKIVGDRIGLHPLTVIFVVLAAGLWFGILGMILAVPVTAALKLVIHYLYSRAVAWRGSE